MHFNEIAVNCLCCEEYLLLGYDTSNPTIAYVVDKEYEKIIQLKGITAFS
jgi:cytochrome c oxidase assembly protein Cox11